MNQTLADRSTPVVTRRLFLGPHSDEFCLGVAQTEKPLSWDSAAIELQCFFTATGRVTTTACSLKRNHCGLVILKHCKCA